MDPSAGSALVLAEKPSVARDIARVLGAQTRGPGYLHGGGYVVTWAIGHLVELPQPHQVDPAWKRWSAGALPMIPRRWPLQVSASTREQFEIVEKLLRSERVERVICATDAGREGELIFRFIYERARCRKPVERLWISSLTADAIRAGFRALRPAREFDALAAAARGRACADWLIGMNLTRAYTLARGERGQVYSVGRVQTPTLAMLVERELAIRGFVPEDYCEVSARLRLAAAAPAAETAGAAAGADGSFEGVYFDTERERALRAQGADDAVERARRLPADGELAEQIAARALSGRARVESVEARQLRLPPPQLYDLTELQRHANRLFGWSATRTLEVAQGLYERAKWITYPRTDSRHLSQSVARGLPDVVRAIRAPYEGTLAEGTGERELGARFVDDARVSDHHAIIPTASAGRGAAPSADERRLFDLICRRLLAAWHEDHAYSSTTVVSALEHPGGVDRYRSRGTRVDRVGWRVLDPPPPSTARREPAGATRVAVPAEPQLPGGIEAEAALDVVSAEALRKKTRPPRRFSEATLLTAMESAGRTLEDRELSEAMRESGLGTPATRAGIIETLIRRGYVTRERKSLHASDKGIALIEGVPPDVKSPVLTGRWEAGLRRIHRGEAQLEPFLEGIEAFLQELLRRVPGRPASRTARDPGAPGETAAGRSSGSAPAPHLPGRARVAARRGERARAAPLDELRWVRHEGVWRVAGPPGLGGSCVRMARRAGGHAQIQLGEPVLERARMALYAVERAGPRTASGPAGRSRAPDTEER